MEQPRYHTLDLDRWPRREHFSYYREKVRCGYSITNRIDVTRVVEYARARKLRFYPCMIHVIATVVNGMDEMRMMLDPEGRPGVWDLVHPNFTVFHKDDHTFSDLWCRYSRDFDTFYQEFLRVMEEYGDCHGVKGRPDQPPNFFCASCVPWMDYTGMATHSVGDPALFPIVDFGKYTQEAGRYTLPMTLTISHASADGYHACQFFQRVQEAVDAFGAE